MIQNGEVWEANWPMCWRGVVQWVGPGDVWCLLSVPEKGVHGGTCMMIHHGPDGKAFYAQAELAERLQENWRKLDGAQLVLLIAP